MLTHSCQHKKHTFLYTQGHTVYTHTACTNKFTQTERTYKSTLYNALAANTGADKYK